jgi:hypothetical protein
MKRFINSKSIPMLVLLSSLLALGLRIWTRGSGPDEGGLFPHQPLAWALLWLLTAAVIAATVFAVRRLKNPGSYRENYPRSPIAALCAVPAAVSFLVSGYQQLRGSLGLALPGTTAVDTVTGILALVAGLCLLLSAVHRFLGRKPFFLINGLICVYLAIRLFNRCQLWSNEPQMGIVVFPFLASMALMLSAYHRVCFDVDLGKRYWSGFWSLMSVYFCVVAMLSFDQPLFYGLCALWQMADLCSLRPLKRKSQILEEPQSPEEQA